MSISRKLLFAGTTSSGSSALFDYFRCFPNTLAIASEMPQLFRKKIYPNWESQNFMDASSYKLAFNSGINAMANQLFSPISDSSILLLNNVVTCLTLRGLELLDNTQAFCITRDPRSTWLRRRELCKKAGKKISVQQFISEYRNQRLLFQQNLTALTKNKGNIYIIRFEDFLLDDSIKLKAVHWAGFNIKDYPVNPSYKPYPKEKSILLHHFYSNQDEINLIKSELAEYCHEKV